MRAVAYIRVSLDDQVRDGVSLAAQESACRQHCARARLTVAEVIRDEGQSSRTPLLLRPAGARLTGLLASGTVDAVVAYSQSRLFRDEREAFSAADLFNAAGVALHLVDRGGAVDVATADGLFVYGISALVDAREVRKLRERVTDAMRHIAETGRKPSGQVYGYDRAGGALVVNEAEATVVRRLFADICAGASLVTLTRACNSAGHPLKRGGKEWTPAGIRKLLTNPVYQGEFRHGGEVWPGTHEPLVTRKQWKAAQAVLASRMCNRGRALQHLTPLLRCGYCGSPVECALTTSGGRQYRYYRCRSRVTQGPGHHERVNANEEAVAAVIWRHTELLLTEGDIERGVELARQRAADGRGRRAQVQKRLQDIGAALERGVRLVHAGGATVEAVAVANAPLVLEQAALQEELAGLATGDNAREWAAIAKGGKRLLTTLQEEGIVEDQLAALRWLYERVDVYRGRLVFRHRGGLPDVSRDLPRVWAPRRGWATLDW